MFKYYADYQGNAQGIEELIGTNAEAFVLGEVLTLSAGAATKAGVDSTGEQKYVALNDITGDGSNTNVAAIRIKENSQFKTEKPGTVVIGNKYTLNAAATSITTTTTNGIFEVDAEITEGDVEYVVGHFTGVDAL